MQIGIQLINSIFVFPISPWEFNISTYNMAIKGIKMIIHLAVCDGNAMRLQGKEAQKLQQISSDEYRSYF